MGSAVGVTVAGPQSNTGIGVAVGIPVAVAVGLGVFVAVGVEVGVGVGVGNAGIVAWTLIGDEMLCRHTCRITA